MPKHGKNYRAALEKLGNLDTEHSLAEGLKLAKETSTTKFDGTVEIHIITNCDPKQADQMVRATKVLPHGTGKSKRVAVFADDAKQKEAKAAGADVVGGQELIDEVLKGNIDFETAVATPDMMKLLAKAAKVLGPKGLMPSPKSGTVTPDVAKAVDEIKKGKIELKLDKQGIIHSVVGKVSFSEANLLENAKALIATLKDAKPGGVKGAFLKSASLSTSMGPGIKLDMASVMEG
jgi:large subunit ribosomal protein L1